MADDAILASVRAWRDCPPGEGELELRLGRREASRFVAGVARDVFEQLECDLQESPGLKADRHWAEVVDYFYATRGSDQARTRVEFDAEALQLRTEHVVKERRHRSVLCRAEDAEEDDDAEVCRVACALERPLSDPPTSCIPTRVRLKQRRRFLDVRGESVVWSYELSKTWSANSKKVVEHLQSTTEPTYEVECELVDADLSYRTSKTDEQIAASLLLKASLLLGDDGNARMDVRDVVGPPPPPSRPPPEAGRGRARATGKRAHGE